MKNPLECSLLRFSLFHYNPNSTQKTKKEQSAHVLCSKCSLPRRPAVYSDAPSWFHPLRRQLHRIHVFHLHLKAIPCERQATFLARLSPDPDSLFASMEPDPIYADPLPACPAGGRAPSESPPPSPRIPPASRRKDRRYRSSECAGAARSDAPGRGR